MFKMQFYNFYKIFQELSVAHCLSSEVINSSVLQSPHQMQNLSFLAIDIYAKLVIAILKVSFYAN
jgi:CCR4-NOT transcription complex subunit 1